MVKWIVVMYIQHALMTEGNHEKNPNQFGQNRDLISVISEYEPSVINFVRRNDLCIQNFITDHSRREWNKSLQLQPLQRCYCENSGSPDSACAMRRHYSITFTQSLQAINNLLALGRVGNLLCRRPS